MESVIFSVRTDNDVGHVRREVARMAGAAGLESKATDEIAIAVTELATNLVRHQTIDGELVVSEISHDARTGLEIIARDRGPGIADPGRAMTDRWSSKGTSGCGLGAVKRLMDEFDIQSQTSTDAGSPPIGTVVTARKWVTTAPGPLQFVHSANSRPIPGETANGDGFFVHEQDGDLLVAVVDGLGHGPEANIASTAAINHVSANPTMELEKLLGELHSVLSGTRGAAISLLRISAAENRLSHVGIGNVATRLYPTGGSHFLTRPGIVGMGTYSRPRLTELPWPRNGTLIVHSDGLSPKWDIREFPENCTENVLSLGHKLMRDFADSNDDATVVVVRDTQR